MAAVASDLGLRPFYRRFELPWAWDDEQEARFRKLWRVLLLVIVVLGTIVALLPKPERTGPLATSVPPRLAKVMIEKQIPPPPPPPPPPEVKIDTPPPPPTEVKPEPKPRDRVAEDLARTRKAREQAQKAGLVALKDELADIRQQFEFNKDQLKPTANTTGEVDGPSKAERSLITSKIGTASAGISSAGQSRGFGSGAGNLGGHSATQMVPSFGGSGVGSSSVGRGDGVRRSGQSGKGSRSREEIELVFDRNKGAIYALYSRALRERPDLQGKMVLEFTIAPTGEVTMCRIVSSELKDDELERRIVTKVKSFRFEAKDVETITTTKPIDFFPG